jgi:hypothetical protein
MQTRTVDEYQFYEFHEDLKRRGFRIIRCYERNSGDPKRGKVYTFVWV